MEKLIFHLEDKGDQVFAHIEGNMFDLAKMLANAMYEERDFKEVIVSSLAILEMVDKEKAKTKSKSDKEDKN